MYCVSTDLYIIFTCSQPIVYYICLFREFVYNFFFSSSFNIIILFDAILYTQTQWNRFALHFLIECIVCGVLSISSIGCELSHNHLLLIHFWPGIGGWLSSPYGTAAFEQLLLSRKRWVNASCTVCTMCGKVNVVVSIEGENGVCFIKLAIGILVRRVIQQSRVIGEVYYRKQKSKIKWNLLHI